MNKDGTKNYSVMAEKNLTDYTGGTKSLTKLNEMVLSDERVNKLVFVYLMTNEKPFNSFKNRKLTLSNFNLEGLRLLDDQAKYFETKEYENEFKDNFDLLKTFSYLGNKVDKATKVNELKEKYKLLLLNLKETLGFNYHQLAKKFNVKYSNLYNFFENNNMGKLSLDVLVNMYTKLTN